MAATPPPQAQPARLLVVEDDDTIRETLTEVLQRESFAVDPVATGTAALERFKGAPDRDPVDLVLLDLMLPGVSGLDVCRYIRRRGFATPILVLSARDSETDRVVGLEVGADDYLVKPFGMRELVARCRALLRRRSRNGNGSEPGKEALRFDGITLYPDECRVTRDGREINLSPKEYRLLEVFLQSPRRVWSRDKLLERVWGIDFMGDSKTVDVHIRWLREKLETNPSAPEYITTVRGFGYRFG
ncbi:MAG: response regulator transcription factor [Cyanobacteriota bacterium]|jgi:two-component system phosphate regulon response regulator PhoB|nr:response regulator transcription factor [Cyanobacteriota bacterium]